MDPKHKGEFAYHIVKNLVSNYIKFRSNKNQLISKSEIKTFLLKSFNKEEDNIIQKNLCSYQRSKSIGT